MYYVGSNIATCISIRVEKELNLFLLQYFDLVILRHLCTIIHEQIATISFAIEVNLNL
jgi:hypothetical protein